MSAPERARAVSGIAEINVTPLVDVLLTLLIIFMVVVPLAPRALDAALPPPATPGDTNPPPALVIAIEPSGVSLNRRPMSTLQELATQLTDVLATRSDRTVFVRSAGRVTYGTVVEVMDVAAGAGATRIGIMGDSAVRVD